MVKLSPASKHFLQTQHAGFSSIQMAKKGRPRKYQLQQLSTSLSTLSEHKARFLLEWDRNISYWFLQNFSYWFNQKYLKISHFDRIKAHLMTPQYSLSLDIYCCLVIVTKGLQLFSLIVKLMQKGSKNHPSMYIIT